MISVVKQIMKECSFVGVEGLTVGSVKSTCNSEGAGRIGGIYRFLLQGRKKQSKQEIS
jgi:hypothetical protein